jgi:hypothetical protein
LLKIIMHNFGRGMWRRVGDYEKQQQQQQQQNTSSKLAQYLEYIQMQKQRAIDAYYGLKKKEETTDKPKDEVAPKDAVTIVESISETEDASIVESISETKDAATIVELISEPELESEEVIREAAIVEPEPEPEPEPEVEIEQKPIANDITIVDLIGEEELLINQPEVVASDKTVVVDIEPVKPSKKRGRKNSGKV